MNETKPSSLPISITQPLSNECIGILGIPGCGKTKFASTFPNPLLLDFDRKPVPGIQSIPFWDDTLVRKLAPNNSAAPPNRRDALITFLEKNTKELAQFTIILDSWTSYHVSFDEYTEWEKPRDGGGDSSFSFFRKKIELSEKIIRLLKNIPTTSIVIVHELVDRDDKGNVTGKIGPFMDGKFKDVMPGKFTDFIRMDRKPIDLDINTGKPILDNGVPRVLTDNAGFYIQLAPTRLFTPVLGHGKVDYMLKHKLSYIPATYENWKKLSQGGT